MKPGRLPAFLRLWIAAAVVLGAVAAPSRGGDPAQAPPVGTPQQQAALAALDRAIARFEALLARDDDARHQAATRAVFAGLKQRRDALRAAFDQARYDDLRTELNLEYQRLAAWMASPPAAPPPSTASSPSAGS